MHECTWHVEGLSLFMNSGLAYTVLWLCWVLNPWRLSRVRPWLSHGPAQDFCCCSLVCPVHQWAPGTAGTGITKSMLFPGIKYPQPARVCVNVHTIYMLPSLYIYTHPIYRYIDLCGVSDHSLLPSPLFLPSPLPTPRNTFRDPSSEWEGKMTRICVKVS